MAHSGEAQTRQQLLLQQQEQQEKHSFQQQKPTQIHLLQQPQAQNPATQHAFFQQTHTPQQANGPQPQPARSHDQSMYTQAIAISGLPQTSASPAFRYSPYNTGQPPRHASQPNCMLDQLTSWTARTTLASTSLIPDQTALSQNIYEQQTVRYSLQGDPYQILTPSQHPSLKQQVLQPASYDYMQQLRMEQSELQHRTLPGAYSNLSMADHPHSQSSMASGPLQQSPAQDQLHAAQQQQLVCRYSFPSSSAHYLPEIPLSSNTSMQLQDDPLVNPMMTNALAMRQRMDSTPNIHPSKVTAKPQDDNLRTSSSSGAFSAVPNKQVARISPAVSSMDVSSGLSNPYHISSSNLPSSSMPQAMGLHFSAPGQAMHQGNLGQLQDHPVHGGSLDARALGQCPPDGTGYMAKRDGHGIMSNGDDEELQWKIPRGVTNIEQIIEQWERGDGPQCPALCEWTVGMRRRERSIFSQRKKLYEEYLRLGSVEAFNCKYKDLPIGRVYAIVSSRNRKQRRESNLANAAQTEQKEAT